MDEQVAVSRDCKADKRYLLRTRLAIDLGESVRIKGAGKGSCET